MNELLEQFLIECRELVAQATDDLLILERAPDDAERLGSVFRAFHTLKGAAGIMDFDAMAHALHAAEDVLSRSRAGEEPITPARVGDYLTCLDQVVQWLDQMEATGEPPADAQASAAAIVARFTTPPSINAEPQVERDDPWESRLRAAAPLEAVSARTALRYRPSADCFFQGEDPLERIETIPGLLALRLEHAGAPAALEDMDPFTCALVFLALLSTPSEAIAKLFADIPDQVEIVALGGPETAGGEGVILSAPARELLEAQVLLLAEPAGDGVRGRLFSAGQVAVNVLRHVGAFALAERVALARVASEASGDVTALSLAISSILAPTDPDEPDDPVGEAEGAETRATQETSARTLRVDVERIDALVKLTGELTIAKNAVGHFSTLAQKGTDLATIAAGLKDQHAVLDRLLDELQSAVLRLRVLPLRHVFQRFPRLVREISAELGKRVQLVTQGDATEADKAIVEALFEPLLHVVRNALDHGIQNAAQRADAGKPALATLHLRAARDGEHVVVEVQDDGAGINLARVRQIAVARGIVTAEDLAAMSDAQATDLIFLPGFSTAQTVTGLSGRGVGMDAVRASVNRMGGQVSVETQAGRGTIVRFILPFTVMVTRVLTVYAGEQVFGIPMDMVVETVRVPPARIADIGAAKAFFLRNRTVPLVSLAAALGEAEGPRRDGDITVVVIGMGGQIGGLAVDRLGERLDVILQPMEGILAGMPGIAGTTLLGDGRVLLVLDVQELLA